MLSMFHSRNILAFNCTNLVRNQQQMSCVPWFVLKRQGQPVNDLTFWNGQNQQDDEGSLKLLTAYRGGSTDVDVWLMNTRRVLTSIESETSASVLSVAEANDDLITLDREGWLKLYDGNTLARKTKLGLGEVGFCKASVLRGNPSMLVAIPGDTKSSVTIWSLRDTCIAARLLPPDDLGQLGMVMAVKLLSDHLLVSGYENGSVLLWNIPECKVLCSALTVFQDPVMAFDAWRNGDVIDCVCASVGNQLTRLRFDASVKDDGDVELSRKNVELANPGVSCVRIRNDGKLFASAGWDFKVRVFGMKKMKPLAVLDYHNATIHSVDFADRWDGVSKYLACSSKDNKVSVYNIFT